MCPRTKTIRRSARRSTGASFRERLGLGRASTPSQASRMADGEPGEPKLLYRVREALRLRHYSDSTEKANLQWIRRFIFFHGVRHPKEMGNEHVAAFLSHLATVVHVAASTQNQALCALIFLYATVLGMDVGIIKGIVRAKRPLSLPVVLTPDEVRAVFRFLGGEVLLPCRILYGSGMRLLEGLRLRVKDLDFARHEITVRDGKGEKDRVTMLPMSCADELRAHLERVRRLHEADLARGLGRAALPDALARKYHNADCEWGWQYVFPSSTYYRDRVSGLEQHRHHFHETVIQREVKAAVRQRGRSQAGDTARVSPLVRDRAHSSRLRHPDGPGAVGPRGRQHDEDLLPCSEQGSSRHPEPRGPTVTGSSPLREQPERRGLDNTTRPSAAARNPLSPRAYRGPPHLAGAVLG